MYFTELRKCILIYHTGRFIALIDGAVDIFRVTIVYLSSICNSGISSIHIFFCIYSTKGSLSVDKNIKHK